MTSSSRATTSRAVSWRGWGSPTPRRADRLLDDPALAGLVDPFDDVFGDGVVDALGAVADPDLALLGLVRLMEALRRLRRRRPAAACASSSPPCATAGPAATGCWPSSASSVALGDHLVAPPRPLDARSTTATRRTAGERGTSWSPPSAPQRRGERTAYDALRVAYRRELLGIAALRPDRGAGRWTSCPRRRRRWPTWPCAALEAALAIARERGAARPPAPAGSPSSAWASAAAGSSTTSATST